MDDASAAAPPAGERSVPSAGTLASAQWPSRLADLVEMVVDALHDKVIRPLLLVARALVFGLLAGTMALVIAALGAIAVVRVLDVYAFHRRVWASDLVVGGFFALVGLVAWSLRRARTESG